MEKRISVIVPVYNVAAYLPDCVESILAQDYLDLEIILIDDGSTDRSGDICDAYADKDSRIRVIHQQNGGAASAKNAGLRVATGEYLSFVDSDDFLEPNVYSYMVALMEQEQADVVHCDFQQLYRDGVKPYAAGKGKYAQTAEEYLPRFLEDWTCALLWNKLYRRSLFRDIFFEEGHAIDDEYFTYQGIMRAGKVINDDRIIYNYRMRGSSVMHSPLLGKRKLYDRLDFSNKRRKNIIAAYPELRILFDRDYMEALVFFSRDPYNTVESLDLIQKNLRIYFKEKNCTMPKIRRWPAVLVLLLGNKNLLLKLCRKEEEQGNRDNLFR